MTSFQEQNNIANTRCFDKDTRLAALKEMTRLANNLAQWQVVWQSSDNLGGDAVEVKNQAMAQIVSLAQTFQDWAWIYPRSPWMGEVYALAVQKMTESVRLLDDLWQLCEILRTSPSDVRAKHQETQYSLITRFFPLMQAATHPILRWTHMSNVKLYAHPDSREALEAKKILAEWEAATKRMLSEGDSGANPVKVPGDDSAELYMASLEDAAS